MIRSCECENKVHTESDGTYHTYGSKFKAESLVKVYTNFGTFHVCQQCKDEDHLVSK